MPIVNRHGVRVFFEDEGRGPPVLLHTGGAGDGRMWTLAGYTGFLSGARRLALDHRGHGRSDQPQGLRAHRIQEYVDDVIAVLDAAQVERAAFVGYSAGATVGYLVAAGHPDRCSALVAIGSVPSPDWEPTTGATGRGDRIRSLGVQALIEGLVAEESEPAPEWLVGNLVETPSEMFALMTDAWAPEPDPWAVLPEIEAPTLLVAGSEELGGDDPALAAARLPHGRCIVLPGYGHLQTFWHGEVTGPVVVEFLRSAVPGFQ